jgi:hypothetical protein
MHQTNVFPHFQVLFGGPYPMHPNEAKKHTAIMLRQALCIKPYGNKN